MSKRQLDVNFVAPLPNEMLWAIGEILIADWKRNKKKVSWRSFINYATINRAMMQLFSEQVVKLKYVSWCIICKDMKGTIAFGCHGGSHCMFHVMMDDKRHKYQEYDSLCRECVEIQCGLCKKGFCYHCAQDAKECDGCERIICPECEQCDQCEPSVDEVY